MITWDDVLAARQKVKDLEEAAKAYPVDLGNLARAGDSAGMTELAARMENLPVELHAARVDAMQLERQHRTAEREALAPAMLQARQMVKEAQEAADAARKRLIDMQIASSRLQGRDTMHREALIALDLKYDLLVAAESERLMAQTQRALGVNPMWPRR